MNKTITTALLTLLCIFAGILESCIPECGKLGSYRYAFSKLNTAVVYGKNLTTQTLIKGDSLHVLLSPTMRTVQIQTRGSSLIACSPPDPVLVGKVKNIKITTLHPYTEQYKAGDDITHLLYYKDFYNGVQAINTDLTLERLNLGEPLQLSFYTLPQAETPQQLIFKLTTKDNEVFTDTTDIFRIQQ